MTISVVIPTFARPALLEATLRSVRRQTHTDLEVLVCDNADDDRVHALIGRLDDSRIRHIRRARNIGMHRNALGGFGEARGSYLFKLDDDDLPTPDALARLHAALQSHPQAAVAFGRLMEFPGDDVARARPATAPIPRGVVPDFGDYAAAGRISLAASLIRREAFDGITVDPRSETAYDLDILLRLADEGVAVHVPEAEVLYRRHEGADSLLAPVRQGLGALVALDAALTRRGDAPLTPGFRAAYESAALLAARGLIRNGQAAGAREVLRSLPDAIDSPALRRLHLATRAPWLARPLAAHANRRHRRYQLGLEKARTRSTLEEAGSAEPPSRDIALSRDSSSSGPRPSS